MSNTKGLNRRDFLKLGGMLAAYAALSSTYAEVFAKGLEKLATTTNVLWLQGQSCSGESISLLNSVEPGPEELLTKYISLVLHQNVGAAQGQVFMDTLDKCIKGGDFVLVFEGSIPMGMPDACTVGGRTVESILLEAIPKAKAVVAAGTCASYGGIPAAEGNLTGAASVKEFMVKHDMPFKNKLINLPSCPTHPKSIVSALAFVAGKGYPEVDPELLTPKMCYHVSTHDNCPRYHNYERKIFSKHFGDPDGCLFKLGCLGPLTRTECPSRQWNSGVNWCIRASSPCIGCSAPTFAKKKDFPFYRISESAHPAKYTEDQRKGA
jgi:hydrogenase small subunit